MKDKCKAVFSRQAGDEGQELQLQRAAPGAAALQLLGLQDGVWHSKQGSLSPNLVFLGFTEHHFVFLGLQGRAWNSKQGSLSPNFVFLGFQDRAWHSKEGSLSPT